MEEIIILHIKTKSEYRFLKALLSHEKMSIKQLRDVVGVDSVHKLLGKLRKTGWSIITEHVQRASNKFGEPCQYGLYKLGCYATIVKARAAIAEWESV